MRNDLKSKTSTCHPTRCRSRRAAFLLASSLPWLCITNDCVAESIVVESALLRLTQQVEVPARAQGVLSAVKVAEGDLVKRGAILAQVDDLEANLMLGRAKIELEIEKDKVNNDVAIRTAKKSLEFNRSEFERLDNASRGLPGSISKSEIETKRFQADQAALAMEEAERIRRQSQLTAVLKSKELEISQHNVAIRKIIAPINGVVVEVLRQPGEWVEPGEEVIRIVRVDRLRAEGLVHSAQIKSDLMGEPAVIKLELPGKGMVEFTGSVTFVSPEINPVNGQVRVWAEFDNPEGLLKPGQRPRLIITPSAATARRTADTRPSP